MMKVIEKLFEKFLWNSRFMVVVASFASTMAALVLIIIGVYDIYTVVKEMSHAFSDKVFYEAFRGGAITHIIGAIDVFLISTVLLIFGVGLYELFVSTIDDIEKDNKSSRVLSIHSLDELKSKLAKVIVMVLIVTFFKQAVWLKYDSALNLLFLGVGVFLIALSVYSLHKQR